MILLNMAKTKTLQEEIVSALLTYGVATKKDLDQFATKKDLEKFATKKDLENYATKEDLKLYATKQDLQEAVDAILSGMEDLLKDIPKKKEVVLKSELKNIFA